MSLCKVDFVNGPLEVFTIVKNGENWMVANPFAEALGYTKPNKVILEKVSNENKKSFDEFKAYRISTTSAPPPLPQSVQAKTKFINRAGVFELIAASKLPAAKRFKQWNSNDLLPKLCEDGEYSMAIDAPADVAEGMNAVHAATTVDGSSVPWMELKQAIAVKDEIIASKTEENKILTVALQEANKGLLVANTNLMQAFNMVNEARRDSENARREIAELANRMADIAQDVIAMPADPQLLHSLAVCAMGGDQYAFVRPQKRSLKRSLDRLAGDGGNNIVFKSDYVPNSMNVLNKVKENLPMDKYKARHNKITLLEDLTKEDLVDAIKSTMTQRQVAIITKKARST